MYQGDKRSSACVFEPGGGGEEGEGGDRGGVGGLTGGETRPAGGISAWNETVNCGVVEEMFGTSSLVEKCVV